MATVMIDSNVLLDLVTEDPVWFRWSEAAIQNAADTSRLVINAVIFAEVSVGYGRIEDMDAALSTNLLEREALPYEAAFLAGKAFATYRRRGGLKRSPLPDFFIGAHAAIGRYRLLTRDAGRYRAYFPTVTLITPD
jgi:predicted nucleic acid-binding protein